MKHKVAYLGNIVKVAEYLYMSASFELQSVVTEKIAFNEEMKYFSLLRESTKIDASAKSSTYKNSRIGVPSAQIMTSSLLLIFAS